MTDQIAHEPYFPPDLERLIFRLAAVNSNPDGIRVLMLVAWRVKDWVEPLLYRAIVIGPFPLGSISSTIPLITFETFDRVVELKGRSWLARTVQHLLLSSLRPAEITKVLQICTGLRRIMVFAVASFHGALDPVSGLRVFQGRLSDFFDLAALQYQISHRPCLAHLTHAEFLDEVSLSSADNERLWQDVLLLPSLTHLACSTNQWNALPSQMSDHVVAALFPAGGLQVFALIRYVAGGGSKELRLGLALRRHPGFVFLADGIGFWARNWSDGTTMNRSGDYWMQAEDFVQKRIAGTIDKDNYALYTPHPII
ncbi:hypothetical protein MIND_00297000 [Mycena indigotica]|uniref:Uncharacterized protein n=1 Tax=Mycena indigotica TaxID=2126181 RepID=A0A8H6T3L1_9AGAR|nr:uncharacterized protein MIND_00297000 [Mycena indigotica]KAF7309267.1 hypothetical protein MIND_00297000 [Mycena indigotica]